MKKIYNTIQKKTIAVEQIELSSIFLKYLLMRSNDLMPKLNMYDLLLVKELIREENERFSRNAALTQIKNICPFTGRSRGFYNFSGMSRLEFKHLAGLGKIPGIRKAS